MLYGFQGKDSPGAAARSVQNRPSHEEVSPIAKIGPVMVQAAMDAKVPVCVHLDHCETLSYMQRALDIGFTGVMYDGSGVSSEDYRIGIRNGLRKINYYSYMSKAGTNAVRELLAKEDVIFFYDLAFAAEKAMSADAEKAMHVFAGCNL